MGEALYFVAGIAFGYVLFLKSSKQLDSEASQIKKHSAEIKAQADIIHIATENLTNAVDVIIQKINTDDPDCIITTNEQGKKEICFPMRVELDGEYVPGEGIYVTGRVINRHLNPDGTRKGT